MCRLSEKSQILRPCDDLDMNCAEQNLRKSRGMEPAEMRDLGKQNN